MDIFYPIQAQHHQKSIDTASINIASAVLCCVSVNLYCPDLHQQADFFKACFLGQYAVLGFNGNWLTFPYMCENLLATNAYYFITALLKWHMCYKSKVMYVEGI